MSDVLLELQTEELPPSFLLKVQGSLENITAKFFEEKKLSFDKIDIFITPRRIGLLIQNIPEYSKKEDLIIIGPPYNASFKDDKPTKALESFLEKNNATKEDIFKYEKNGGVYIAIKKQIGGKSLKELIKDFPYFVIESIPYKKLMRWDNSNIKFPRPIRGILLFIDDEAIYKDFTIGHRFLSYKLNIKHAKDYENLLKEHFVIPRFNERKQKILSLVNDMAKELNLIPDFEEDLIDEITNLVEYPYLIVGKFDREFLELPDFVIKTVLARHQRFICTKKDGYLQNIFFGISNMPDEKGFIKEGYQKVVKARLRDAVFFYQEDLKKTLEFFVNELEGIMFHHKLGTMLEKTNRHIMLASAIDDSKHLQRACYLSLFDLATSMVKEFDELQGYVGMIYAKAKNEEKEVYMGLLEQYMPDKIMGNPTTKTGALLGIIIKIDNVISLISAGEIPKGSSDAYAIKKNIYGIIRLILDKDLDINLKDVFKQAYELLKDKSKLLPYEEAIKHIEDLFLSRILTYFEDFDYDIVRAVLDVEHPFNIKSIKQKIELLQKNKTIVENVAKSFKRIRKIIPKNFTPKEINQTLFENELEQKLFDFLQSMPKDKSTEDMLFYINNHSFLIDEFFDKILVMSEDINIRHNRLSLLYRLYKNIETVANFEHIVIKEVI